MSLDINRKVFGRANYNAELFDWYPDERKMVAIQSDGVSIVPLARYVETTTETGNEIFEPATYDVPGNDLVISVESPKTGRKALFRFLKRDQNAKIDYYVPIRKDLDRIGYTLEYHYS